MDEKPPQRVMCYIDGFNLYYGLRDAGLRRFYWLDLAALATRVVLPSQKVVGTKYFTSRISGGRPDDRPIYRDELNAKRKRQATYLDALAATDGIKIYEGQFLASRVSCNKCGASWADAEEKMTDVNIATELIVDAFANRFDTALLISGDSDLVPPVRAVLSCFPHKRVVVAFPPERWSKELKEETSAQFMISKGQLKKSQLPEEIKLPSGHLIKRPDAWS